MAPRSGRHEAPQGLGQSQERHLGDGLPVEPIPQQGPPHPHVLEGRVAEVENTVDSPGLATPEHLHPRVISQACHVGARDRVGKIHFARLQRSDARHPGRDDAPFDTI